MKGLLHTLTALSLCGAVACGSTASTADSGEEVIRDAGPAINPAMPSITSTIVIDRIGRPFVLDLLISSSTTSAATRDKVRTEFNEVGPQTSANPGELLNQGTANRRTAAYYVLKDLSLFDSLDGVCGQGNLTVPNARADRQYQDLAAVLANDRIWIDTSASMTRCDTFFAVERRAFGLLPPPDGDCGGRAPHVDALDAMLQLLTTTTISDGVDTDDGPLMPTEPFFELP